MIYFSWISSEKNIFSVTLLAMYHLILMEKGLFMWRAPRAMVGDCLSPCCAPLRALAWGVVSHSVRCHFATEFRHTLLRSVRCRFAMESRYHATAISADHAVFYQDKHGQHRKVIHQHPHDSLIVIIFIFLFFLLRLLILGEVVFSIHQHVLLNNKHGELFGLFFRKAVL